MRLALIGLFAFPAAAFAQCVNPTGMTVPSFETAAFVASDAPAAPAKAPAPFVFPGTPAFTMLSAAAAPQPGDAAAHAQKN